MEHFLQKHKTQIDALCLQHHVLELSAFGSVLTDRFSPQSDVDLLVRFGSVPLDEYADNYFDFCEALENLLNSKIDLVFDKAVRNPYFKQELEETKQLLFAA